MSKFSRAKLEKAERVVRARREREALAVAARSVTLDVDDYVLDELNQIARNQGLSLSQLLSGLACELVHNCNRAAIEDDDNE